MGAASGQVPLEEASRHLIMGDYPWTDRSSRSGVRSAWCPRRKEWTWKALSYLPRTRARPKSLLTAQSMMSPHSRRSSGSFGDGGNPPCRYRTGPVAEQEGATLDFA
jgi:hypothetical protein